jgi:hypothetical protein
MQKRLKTTKKNVVNTDQLVGYVYSNQFPVLQTKQYDLLKAIIRGNGVHTKTGSGQYEVPTDTPMANLICRYYDICSYKNTALENGDVVPGIQRVERIRIQETGLSDVGNTVNSYEKIGTGMARFVFNFHETEGRYVCMSLKISKAASATVPIVRSIATVLPQALSEFSINSSNQVGHRSQSNSVFVIIDCTIHNNVLNQIASKMAMSTPIKVDALISALEKMEKEGKFDSLSSMMS